MGLLPVKTRAHYQLKPSSVRIRNNLFPRNIILSSLGMLLLAGGLFLSFRHNADASSQLHTETPEVTQSYIGHVGQNEVGAASQSSVNNQSQAAVTVNGQNIPVPENGE